MQQSQEVVIIGRFPPPLDGQALLTERLAHLLSTEFNTTRVDTNTSTSIVNKLSRFARLGSEVQDVLSTANNPVIVWPSISPRVVGHFRDRLSMLSHTGTTPIVAVIHWGNFDQLFRDHLTRSSAANLVRRVSKFVFNDAKLARTCADWIPVSKVATINNSIDPAIICTSRQVEEKTRRGPSDPFKVLYLSNMITSKGYLDVLSAASMLQESKINFTFDFVGDWLESKDTFEKLVLTEGLQEVVTHHGQVSERARIRSFMLESDAFVLPTYYPNEAQPSAIIEAMSAGTPVVTCDHGGISEMLSQKQQDLFVASKTPSDLATRLVTLTNPETWRVHSKAARDRFDSKFDPEGIKQLWYDLIYEVSETHK